MDSQKEIITQHVAAKLRATIAEKSMMKKDIASGLEIPITTLSRYLNGHREIPVSIFVRICEHLGVDPGAILDDAIQES